MDILKHGRDKLTLDDEIGALNSKDLQHKVESQKSAIEALAVNFRTEKGDPRFKGRSRSKSRSGKKVIKCFHCHEEGHMKKDCPNRRKNSKIEPAPNVQTPCVVLVMRVRMSYSFLGMQKSSIGPRFRGTSHRKWVFTHRDMVEGEMVCLGNN